MTQLSATGLQVSRLADRLLALQTALQTIFGPGLDLSPNTIDGQTAGIFAAAMADLDALVEEVYNATQPQNATGATLSRLVQLNGLTRIAGTYSTVTVTLGGRNGTIVPAGTLLRSTVTNAVFSTNAAVTIGPAGLATVAATASVIGAQQAPAGSLTGIDTPVFGLQTATNVAAATAGREVETDGELRARRAKSAAYPSQTVREGIEAAIANLAGVTDVRVYENDQPAADPDTGQPKNSIYAVVQGGTDADIGRALLLKKTAGVPTVGSTQVTVTDTEGHSRTLQFSRPVPDNVYVRVVVSRRAGFPSDGEAQIKAAIVAYASANFSIGEEVVRSDLFEALAGIPGKSVSNIAIGLAPNPTGTGNLVTAYDHLALFDVSRVSVEFV